MRLFGKKTDAEDLIYEAVSYLEKGQPKIAIPILNNILKEEPKNTTALYNKGLALNQIRKYNDAITSFDKVLEINPNDTPSLNNKAIALAELGRHKEAIEVFDNLLAKHKENVNVLYAKSRSMAALEHTEESLALLGQAIAKDSKTIKKWAKQEKIFEKLSDDERFRKLVT